MTGTRVLRSVWLAAGLGLALAGFASGQVTSYDYDYTGYDAPSADLETLLGPKLAELDAKATGFSFGGVIDPLRNLNIISQVYEADEAVTIGLGGGGTSIALEPGDYTFAYTLDYSQLSGGATNSPVNDFQLYRLVVDEVFSVMGGGSPISNPGQTIATDNIMAGGYNTAAGFGGQALIDLTGELVDYTPLYAFQSAEVEFNWDANAQVLPGSKVMVFLFCRDVEMMQIGWNPTEGYTGEGGNVIGGGLGVEQIPVIVPVIVPEPISMLLAGVGIFLLPRRRRGR